MSKGLKTLLLLWTSVATLAAATPALAPPAITSLDATQINTRLPFTLVVKGTNFLPETTAAFNDQTALRITSRSATTLTVTGVSNAAAGTQLNIILTNPGIKSTAASTKTVQVEAPVSIAITPTARTMRGDSSGAFAAQVANTSNRDVIWQVNGVAGGNAALGLITTAGLYTAPVVVPASVTITATSLKDGTKSASAAVSLMNPVPSVTSATTPITAGNAVTIVVNGTGFAQSAQVTLAGVPLAVTWINATQLRASGKVVQANGGVSALRVINPNPGTLTSNTIAVTVNNAASSLSYAAAKRFLEQATWGPTPASIAYLQSIGIDAWLNEQLDPNRTPVSVYMPPVDDSSDLSSLQKQFFANGINGRDQLRQRVAFALSQIAVVSGVKLPNYHQMMPYQQMLLNDAFGKYKDFLRDVTLSPAMGHYLDMVNNDIPSARQSANENYAREFMQLFTIGLQPLSAGGAPQPGSTYTEDDVKAMARVLTGWTYAPCQGASKWTTAPCFQAQLVPFETHHDNSAKMVLGTNIATGSAEGDLDLALSTVESYRGPQQAIPNVAPFVALRLIQHLVTGQPSPQYVARIAQVYVNTGGDLGQIVRAILKDSAAGYGNGGAALPVDQGHLREPVLYALTLLRALGATAVYAPPIAGQTRNMGQDLFFSPSVFNYYSPFYRLSANQAAPEFQTLSQATAFYRANYAYRAVHNQIDSNVLVDLTNFAQLAADTNNLNTLLNAVGKALLGQPMPPEMSAAIMPALLATTDPWLRARTAVYLVAAAPQYQVEQ